MKKIMTIKILTALMLLCSHCFVDYSGDLNQLIEIECLKEPEETTGFNGGDGSDTDPYIICAYEQLGKMRDGLDKHYKLGSNINASASWSEGVGGCTAYDGSTVPTASHCSGWVPVGNDSTKFTGSLDGVGYVISNLYVNLRGTGNKYGGLFGYTDNAELANLALANVRVDSSSGSPSSSSYAGGLVGYNNGGNGLQQLCLRSCLLRRLRLLRRLLLCRRACRV